MLSSIRENIERRLGIASRPALVKTAAAIENLTEFSGRYKNWRRNEVLDNYPFVENINAPFTPARRALPMLNLALISSAGAFMFSTNG